MFRHVEFYPGDPILGLMEKYNQDPRSEKVNLSVGVYYDGKGRLPVLECVKTVERALAESPRPRGYLPMEGLAAYRHHPIARRLRRAARGCRFYPRLVSAGQVLREQPHLGQPHRHF